jgi:hypothetical protein
VDGARVWMSRQLAPGTQGKKVRDLHEEPAQQSRNKCTWVAWELAHRDGRLPHIKGHAADAAAAVAEAVAPKARDQPEAAGQTAAAVVLTQRVHTPSPVACRTRRKKRRRSE